jgi:hypothetical protein
MAFDYQEYQENKIRKGLFYKNKGKEKCSVCGWLLCTCQVNLLDWIQVNKLHNENPEHGCQKDCINQGEQCLECYAFNKYKGAIPIK